MIKLLVLIYKQSSKERCEPLGTRKYNKMIKAEYNKYSSITCKVCEPPNKDLLNIDILMLKRAHIFREVNKLDLILTTCEDDYKTIDITTKITYDNRGLNYDETYERIEITKKSYMRTKIPKSLLLHNKILYILAVNPKLKSFLRYYRHDL
jgi:hypothetical protein